MPDADSVRLTPIEREAVERARKHPRLLLDGHPRTVKSLLNKGVAKVTHYGEGMDGPLYAVVLHESSDDA